MADSQLLMRREDAIGDSPDKVLSLGMLQRFELGSKHKHPVKARLRDRLRIHPGVDAHGIELVDQRVLQLIHKPGGGFHLSHDFSSLTPSRKARASSISAV